MGAGQMRARSTSVVPATLFRDQRLPTRTIYKVFTGITQLDVSIGLQCLRRFTKQFRNFAHEWEVSLSRVSLLPRETFDFNRSIIFNFVARRTASVFDLLLEQGKKLIDDVGMFVNEISLLRSIIGQIEQLHRRQTLLFRFRFFGRAPATATMGQTQLPRAASNGEIAGDAMADQGFPLAGRLNAYWLILEQRR